MWAAPRSTMSPRTTNVHADYGLTATIAPLATSAPTPVPTIATGTALRAGRGSRTLSLSFATQLPPAVRPANPVSAKGVPGGLGTVESDHEDVLSDQTLLFPVPAYCRARRPAASRRVAPATTPASVSLRCTVVSGSASAGSTSTRCREPRPPGRSSPACLVCRHRVAPADFRQALGLHRDVGRHQRPCRALPRACLLPLYRVRMRRVNTLFRLVMLSLTRKRGQRGVGDCAEECQHSRWGQPEKSFDGRADDCEQDSGDEQCEKRRHSLSAVQIRFGGCGRVAESRASHRGARCSALARSRRRPNGSNHEPEHHAENGTPRRRRQRQGDQEQNDGQEQNAVPARGR